MSSDPFAKKPYNDITQLDDENNEKKKQWYTMAKEKLLKSC
jgi:hypothetical protein